MAGLWLKGYSTINLFKMARPASKLYGNSCAASAIWLLKIALNDFLLLIFIIIIIDFLPRDYSDEYFMMDCFMIKGLSVFALKGFSSFRSTEMIQLVSSACVCVCLCEHIIFQLCLQYFTLFTLP